MKHLKTIFLFTLVTILSTGCTFNNSYKEKKDKDGNIIPTVMQRTYKDMSKNSYYNYDYSNSIGDNKVLVIPVWFTDSETYININNKETVRTDIEKAYLGTKEETGWNSVKSFYEEESLGRLNYLGTVTSWYECGDASSDYYDDRSGFMKTKDLVFRASEWYFSTNNVDRKEYDKDSNGYLDGVMLIYGAPDYSSIGMEDNNMWAYCYWLSDSRNKNVDAPGPNVFFWASYDFIYGTEIAMERTGKTSYGGGDTKHCNIDAHTYIHEMGHVFGLDDYYDYGSKHYKPAGGFSMQDYNIGGHDPYSAMSLGWTDPIIPTTSQEITIRPYATTHDVILLTPSWNLIDSPFDEYILVELYTPTGLNELDATYSYSGYNLGPSKTGLRLWHVDARLLYSTELAKTGRGSYPAVSINKMTTDPLYKCKYGVQQAFSNTYDGGYLGPLGKDYANYNLLQYIRNSGVESYKPKSSQSDSNLFLNDNSFTINEFANQFVLKTTLNNGKKLSWKFDVKINGVGNDATATIKLTKSSSY